MRRNLNDQIRSNIRMTWVYSSLLVVLLAALGAVIVGYYSPKEWPIGALGAALLGLIGAGLARAFGTQAVLSISQARSATPQELQIVNNVAEEVAIAAGLPMPKVYIIEDSAPNAFATGMSPETGVICVTTGLLRKLDRDELQGVVAHEMAHIRNYDVRLSTTLAVIAGFIPLLADFYRRMVWFGGGRRRSRDNDSNGQLEMILAVLGIVLMILAPLFASLLQLAVSRQREFMADATGARLTRYPEGLASALEKIAMDPEPLEAANRATAHMYIVNPLQRLEAFSTNILSSHPPTAERIRILRGSAGNLENLESSKNLL